MLFNILSIFINSNNVYIAETYKQIMHNCINHGIAVPNDTADRRIARTIENVAAGDLNKMNIMLTFFDESSNYVFKEYLFNNISDEEKSKHNISSIDDLSNSVISKININTLKSIITKFYRNEIRDVDNYDSKEANDVLEGFTSHVARYSAKVYCATKILELYHATKSTDKIVSSLKTLLNNEYVDFYVVPLINEILNGTSNHFTKSQIELANQINEYNKRVSEIRKTLLDYKKKGKITKEEKAKSEELKKERSDIFVKRNTLIYNLNKSIPAAFTAFKNFGTLFNIISNPESAKRWYEEVFRLKRLVNGKHLFDVLTEEEKQTQSIIEDEESWTQYDNDDSIDLTAKTWSESIARSYEQNVANDVKLYLSSIYEVEVPVKENMKEDDITFKINPELGVKIAMSPEFIIQQLSNLEFTSTDDFLRQVYEVSQTIPELYGLGHLYIKMRNNPLILNRIFVELAQNKQYKLQAYVSANGNYVQISNQEIQNTSSILYKLVTSAINTYRANYIANDLQELTRTINRAEEIFKNPIQKDKAIKFALEYVNKYFPSIPTNTFANYLYRQNITVNEFRSFFNNLLQFQKQIANIKKLFVDAQKVYDEQVREYKKKLNEQESNDFYADLFGTSSKKEKLEKPKMDTSSINYDSLYEKLLPLAQQLSKVTLIDNQLNSYNAENNMSSDLLPNSRITNIIKQLSYEHKDENGNITQVGLERLKEFITDSNGKVKHQYRHSNLFFGSGTTKGIFTLHADGRITINKEAKDLIRVALFDGIKNRTDNDGILYSGMSKGDYFVTMIETFHRGINFYDNSHKGKGGYFMRTPSDAPKNFIIQTTKFKYTSLITPKGIDRNSDFYKAIKNIVLGELNDFIHAIDVLAVNGIISNEVKTKYFEHYHYNKRQGVIKDGKLTGNVFHFTKLPETNGHNLDEAVQKALFLYGGENTSLLSYKNGNIEVNQTVLENFRKGDISVFEEELNNAIDNWITNFIQETDIQSIQYRNIIGDTYNPDQIREAMLNYVIAYNKFDELFEGDAKFYADARTFLKRAKEAQAGGKAYSGFNFNDSIAGEYIETNPVFTDENLHQSLRNIKARNGFKAITIVNTIKPSKYADALEEELYQAYKKQNYDDTKARQLAKQVSDKYRGRTKTNDAQSYITLEEFIRREYAKGTLDNYKDLLNEIYNLKPDENGNYDTSKINLEGINARIQVQKNFYYDIAIDEETGLSYPRQIKNAEFVLIPQLLPANSTLRQLYDIMTKYDIGQINTSETSKAAKKNVLTYWDNDGNVTEKNKSEFISAIEKGIGVDTYYYRNLYKQQDIPSHLKDQRNKAGIQIMKKVLDNINDPTSELQPVAKQYFEAYSANIKNSFYQFIDNMGWKYDEETDKIVNADGSSVLNFDKYYELARNEAIRLGLDSNFIDYLVPSRNGRPIMPNYMNNVSTKLESIAQSMFNNHITRQTLPGWHCAQITNIGFDKELKFHKDRYVLKGTTNVITSEEYNKLSVEEQEKYEPAAVVDVMIPRWSNMIPKDYPIEKLREEGLLIQIGYRIPTEGKQSVCIFNVVDFLDDIYDSTIVVPDEWVEETGSDMDGDSVYGVSYPMEWIYTDTSKYLSKVKPNFETDEKNTRNRYETFVKNELRRKGKTSDLDLLKNTPKELYNDVFYNIARENNIETYTEFKNRPIIDQQTQEQRESIIVDCMVKILLHHTSREENLTGSHFNDLTESMKKYEHRVKYANSGSAIKDSAYNPFTQINYMENAMSGARLKAFSVNRDTFNSVANLGHAMLSKHHEIVISYPVGEYSFEELADRFGAKNVTKVGDVIQVRHNRWAWSKDNRNVDGKIITSYSSQTTAHILDAVKEGTIFNENEFTFSAFKTLLDVGSNYDTAIAFIMQPGITAINEAYYETNSLYVNSYGNPIMNAFRSIGKRLNIKIDGKEIDQYTPISKIIDEINKNKELINILKELYGIQDEFESNIIIREDKDGNKYSVQENTTKTIDITKINYPINLQILEDRLYSPKSSDRLKDIAVDIATILTFQKLKKTSDNVENILNVSKPDRFGAKQTIRETRNIVEKIENYSDPKNPIAKTLVIEGKIINKETGEEETIYTPFVKILYSDYSFYPYINAFYKFSTKRSVEINKQLFDLENGIYVRNEKYLEKLIGRPLSNEEYKLFKQYIVASSYNGIEIINKPLTINSKGFIVVDEERLDEYSAYDNGYDAGAKERFRIYGINSSNNVSLELKDFNEPTNEELAEFNRLSPAEKVLWIQKNFKDNAGIFSLLNVRTFNYNEFRDKGYSTSTITFNDSGKDIDELIAQFNNKYHSKHPFVKLAVIDLIKYAFYVEGFNFKTGNISKIVSNKALLDLHLGDNLNVVDSIKNIISNNIHKELIEINERFIRANSYIVPNIELKKDSSLHRGYLKSTVLDDLYGLSTELGASQDVKDFIEYLTKNKDELPRYIRLTTTENKQKVTRLYKIVAGKKIKDEFVPYRYIYFYPLNELESKETTNISSNIHNNNYRPESYYQDLIELNEGLEYRLKEYNIKNSELDKAKPEVREKLLELKNEHKIKSYEFDRVVSTLENPNVLIDLANSSDTYLANEVKTFMKKIDRAVKNKKGSYRLIAYPGYKIKTLFEVEGNKDLTIPYPVMIIGEDGNYYPVIISKYSLSKTAFKELKSGKRNPLKEIGIEERQLLDAIDLEQDTTHYYYKIETVLSEDTRKTVYDAFNNGNEKLSATSSFYDNIEIEDDVNNDYPDLTKITKKIIDNIRYNKRRAVVDERDMFMNRLEKSHVDVYSLVSIYDNNEIIFRSIAEYYRTVTSKLLKDIEEFRASNGEKYNIGDKALYEHLVKDDSDYAKVVDILLRARNINQSLKTLFQLNISAESKIVQDYINNIQKYIESITKNNSIKDGFNHIFNIYFAKKYSNNPNVKNGLVLLTEQFGDATKADLLLSDTEELDNKQVQVVAKMVYSIISEAEQVTGPKAAIAFEKAFDNILAKDGDFNFDNIIDKEGKFVRPYTEEFIKDRTKKYEELIKIKEEYGTTSKQYLDYKLKYDKWKLENTEQELIEDYYKEKLANEEELYNKAQDLYIKYIKLKAQLGELKDGVYEDEETIRKRNLIQLQIRDLFSPIDELSNVKSNEEINKITALKNYFAKKSIISEKYFGKKVNAEFLSLVNYYEDIIKKYDKVHSDETIDQKLQNEQYKNAYYWLASNGHYDITGEVKSEIIEAFALLRNENTSNNSTLNSMLKEKDRLDAYGTIDGRKFSEAEVEKLRKGIELSFNTEDSSESDNTLIKDIPSNESVYNKQYYSLFVSDLTTEQKSKKRELQYKINQILIKGFDTNNHLSAKLLFENCTNEELEKLASYYKEIRSMGSKMTKEELRRLNEEVDFKTNNAAFNEEYNYYKLNLIGDRVKAKLWKDIFLDWSFDELGYYTLRLEDGVSIVPNRMIYGYAVPKDKYINKAKTKAKEFINKNVEFITTEYYIAARNEAINNGVYEEWFRKNHVYNPYNREWQPLPIWTKMSLKPTSDYADSYKFIPNQDNVDVSPKTQYINDKYCEVPGNYKGHNYDSGIKLTRKEEEMLKLLQDTIKTFAFDSKAKAFADKGYVPRRYKSIEDKEFYIRQAIGVVGLDYKSHKHDEFYDRFDFNNDEEISFNMLDFIKGKGYKNTKKLLPKLKGETETEWKERNKDIIEYNEKVKKDNLAIDNSLMDRDWRSVFHDFVVNATIYEARNKVKDSLYLLLQSLKDTEAYDVNAFGKVKTTKHSTKELVDYQMTEQKNYYSVVENWARRLIHSQFKEKSMFRDIADLMQNVTSAKYMILNVTGGVANITTGLTNIMGENFAKDYFGGAEFRHSQKRYFANATRFIAEMYNDTSDNYDVALTKFFDVVDFDAMLERKPSGTTAEKIERARDLLYSLQAGGEHYMQNSVLFAMLQSTRIYEEDGRIVIGSFAEYINNIEKQALVRVIGDDTNLLNAYKYYIAEIKSDANKKKNVDRFNYDAYVEFARTHFTKEQIKDFIKYKEEITKDAKEKFDKLQTIESQLELKNGRIELKENAVIDNMLLQEFRRKVISVNKLIHGVYDKYGAARLERKWYGSLIMQYHKHLYPGIMKRYRGLLGSGYYNELRGGVAYGSYVSLAKFLSTDFRRIQFKDENGDFVGVLISIQNIAQATIDTFTNMSLNWGTMAEWEKRNCRRALGDLAGVAAALLSAILLHAFTDDDELKDSDTLSTALYLIDRLNTEASMYTPWGLVTETKTLYSSPIAMTNLPEDILKSLEYSVRWIFDDDFNIDYPSGQYAGQNKIAVRLKRNIPIYRVYDRLSHMAQNNQYYRIGDNNWNIKLSKNIANFINPEE